MKSRIGSILSPNISALPEPDSHAIVSGSTIARSPDLGKGGGLVGIQLRNV
jgi:hypothetical protein